MHRHPLISHRLRYALAAPLIATLAFTAAACDDGKSSAAAPSATAKATAAQAPATATAETKPAKAAPEQEAVTCKALIEQIIKLQEAEKKDGLIRRSNADKMGERCEKADNIKDNAETVDCIMKASDVKAMQECKEMGKLLAPW